MKVGFIPQRSKNFLKKGVSMVTPVALNNPIGCITTFKYIFILIVQVSFGLSPFKIIDDHLLYVFEHTYVLNRLHLYSTTQSQWEQLRIKGWSSFKQTIWRTPTRQRSLWKHLVLKTESNGFLSTKQGIITMAHKQTSPIFRKDGHITRQNVSDLSKIYVLNSKMWIWPWLCLKASSRCNSKID